jgi:hypothetical protein
MYHERLDVYHVISYAAFLARALLSSRSSGKSNLVVGYLVRTVVQIGVYASLWAIGGLVTWPSIQFLMQQRVQCTPM